MGALLNLNQTYEVLNKSLSEKAMALPKGFNQQRFVQNCMTVLTESKDLQSCDIQSVKRTLLKGAYLGLDFLNKECYAIKYKDQLTFQTDWKGEKKLVMKYSVRPVRNLFTKLIREGDDFEEAVINGEPTVNFKPKPFNDGDILGAFAIVYYEDGGMEYETMSVAEIETVRQNYSKAPNSPAWKNSYGEMCRKTVLRRLCKSIQIDFETIEMQKEFEAASDFKFDNDVKAIVAEDVSANANTVEFDEDDVVDAEFTEVGADDELEKEIQEVFGGK